MLGLSFLWGNPGRTQGQSLPPERGRAGAAGKGEGPWGHQLRQPHPSPHDLRQDPEPIPTTPSRRSPQSPTTRCGCMSARSRCPEPPDGGQGWRVIGRGSARRGGGAPAPRAGKEAEEGAQGGQGGRAGGASGVRGARGGCGGRRAHLPPVSAAIAGHMTEAVAGMTVWALATRGGRPREGGGEFAEGVQTERVVGRTAPASPVQVLITVSFDPLPSTSPCPSAPKQKWRRRPSLWREGVACGSEGRTLNLFKTPPFSLPPPGRGPLPLRFQPAAWQLLQAGGGWVGEGCRFRWVGKGAIFL